MTGPRITGGIQELQTESLIASFPAEVLTSIFIEVKATDEIEHWDGKQLEWIKITHVCRYWRAVGIRARCLWTNIPMYSKGWALEMLKRSKDMSIVATVDFTGSSSVRNYPSYKALGGLLENFSRIQELNLIKAYHMEATPFLDLTLPAGQVPRLHTLRFGGQMYFDDYSDILCFRDSTFFQYLDLSSLRRLSLTDCHLNWTESSQLLRNLTHIRVISDHQNNLLDKGVEPFFDVLRNVPHLESLDFEYFVGPSELPEIHPLPAHFQRVALPNLKILRLGVQMCQLELILQGLDIPSDAFIKLYCYELSTSFDRFSPVLSAYASHLARTGKHIRTFELSNYTPAEFKIAIWPTVLLLETLHAIDTPPIMETIFCWDHEDAYHPPEMIYSHVLNVLKLEHLESLKLHDYNVVKANTWKTTFGTLPKLASIDLCTTNSRGLWTVLESHVDNNDTESKGDNKSLPFSSLRDVAISFKNITCPTGMRVYQGVIYHAVKLRSTIGAGLKRLIIFDAPVLSGEVINQIREIVPVIEKSRTSDKDSYSILKVNAGRCGLNDLDDTDDLMGVWR
ncbi:hypothetical protein JR316_0001814 [Psilocybe cubensis]|uniref:Uncharacterized protein n=2 Tax=Psilocybe cubensis TaxID=181762 RepID=A0ACB8HB79_PSICU|nr:hypothetical protein JR316_0001814 [Psilocybe cubensis]KAH9484912.1 hypothetical protein JR316_0001814 [Psilocybe cubensis]